MKARVAVAGFLALAAMACADHSRDGKTLTLGSYTSARELFHDGLIPGFRETAAGRTIRFRESYQGSGHQSRAVMMGFEADIVALSYGPDVKRLADAGLTGPGWETPPEGGRLASSLVAFAVRAENPAGIRGWADLARPELEIVMPNPKVSGGARWVVTALYAAAMRGAIEGVPAQDVDAAAAYLAKVIANVETMSKTSRDSMLLFERGIGDVALTYENEIIAAQNAGAAIETLVPAITLRVELPVAVIDGHTERHGSGEAARAFIHYLETPEAVAIMREHGFRSASTEPGPGVITIVDLGGWSHINPMLFGRQGLFLRTLEAIR